MEGATRTDTISTIANKVVVPKYEPRHCTLRQSWDRYLPEIEKIEVGDTEKI